MTDSNTIAKCLEHAISIMQFMEGKEHLFAIGKMIIFTMFLGGAE